MSARKKGARRKPRQRALLRFSRSDLRRKQRQTERQEKVIRFFINSLVNARISNSDNAKTQNDPDASEGVLAREPFPGTGSDDK